jgi:hypothetical protein
MRRAVVSLSVALALLGGAAACGDDDGGDEEAGASSTTTATTAATDGSTTSETPTSANEPDDTTTTTEGDLPGEPIDIYPYEGAHLGVVGVAAGDTLNVRSGPGTDFAVVTELNPLSQEPTATGQNRTVDDAIWVEVDVDGTLGWVNGAYVAQPGSVVDITADVGEVSAADVAALAEAVAASRASSGEEGPTPTVTIVDGPTDTEVTVDVIGLADDAQKGERLLITAAPGGDGVVATTVEAIALCARGVSDDGLCV